LQAVLFCLKGDGVMQLYQGDCLEVMKNIPDNSIDMILYDLPYGTTANAWDKVIPFPPLWEAYRRITRPHSAIVLFSQMPFTAALANSNLKEFRYEWIWKKSIATGFLNAKRMPLKAHENICIFYRELPTYNPQFWYSTPYKCKQHGSSSNYHMIK